MNMIKVKNMAEKGSQGKKDIRRTLIQFIENKSSYSVVLFAQGFMWSSKIKQDVVNDRFYLCEIPKNKLEETLSYYRKSNYDIEVKMKEIK